MIIKKSKIILATKSPHRQAAFKMLDIEFLAEGSSVEEKFDGRPDDPEELVKYLAKLKAEAVAKNHTDGIIIGFDSIGWFNGQVLEKPISRQEAVDRIKLLSGQRHEFYTGVYIVNLNNIRIISDVVKTEIELREIEGQEIEKYLDQDPNYNTYAIGYDPLGSYSSTFPKYIKGSYNNYLRGIPLERIVEMLKEAGYVVQ